MPRIRSKAKPDPNKVYVAWGFAIGNDVITKGSRRRGDDWVVRQAFHQFVEDGLAEGEAPSELDSLNTEGEDNPQNLELQLYEPLVEYSQPDLRVLRRNVRAGVGLENGQAARVVELRKGAVFLVDAEIVRLRPDLFENGSRS